MSSHPQNRYNAFGIIKKYGLHTFCLHSAASIKSGKKKLPHELSMSWKRRAGQGSGNRQSVEFMC